MGSAAKLRTVICLLRNDLRVHDNEALLWAHNNADHVVPLYCFDPDIFKVGRTSVPHRRLEARLVFNLVVQRKSEVGIFFKLFLIQVFDEKELSLKILNI